MNRQNNKTPLKILLTTLSCMLWAQGSLSVALAALVLQSLSIFQLNLNLQDELNEKIITQLINK